MNIFQMDRACKSHVLIYKTISGLVFKETEDINSIVELFKGSTVTVCKNSIRLRYIKIYIETFVMIIRKLS